jgi:hypothetical protein
MAAGLLALVTGLGLLPSSGAVADEGPTVTSRRDPVSAAASARPLAVPPTPRTLLSTADRVLTGGARAGDPSASLALRDLWMARPDLVADDARRADALLARPTDGAADPYANGYTVPSTKSCSSKVCVHYVTSTADAPPSAEWVDLTMRTIERTWKVEVGRLGYRRPVPDGSRGGSDKLDVYLKDLGTGLYGYCAGERRSAGRTASGFCVLDNDYAPAQFPTGVSPEQNLEVTAAHEFFHAVQYAYDYTEDPWMLESTATWMEERVADGVNDNRQYLPYSQLYAPYVPLDAFSSTYGFQYGNWIFWEYLSQRFGKGFVKAAWNRAGSLRRDGGDYSVQALKALLRRHGGLTDVYAQFAGSTTVPGKTYSEGRAYADPEPLRVVSLTKAARAHREVVVVDHLSADSLRFVPDAGLGNPSWRLKVAVAGPARRTSPAAHLVVRERGGGVDKLLVRLDRRGRAVVRVPFSARRVKAVTVTVVNASTRFSCRQRTQFACAGSARDDDQHFTVRARAVTGR